MDYGCQVGKSPSLNGQKSTPKFLGTAKAYFVCTSAQIFRFLWLIPSLGVRSPWTRSQPTQPAAHSRFCFQFSRKLDSRETTKVRNVLVVEFQIFYIKWWQETRIKILIWLCADFLVLRASFQNLLVFNYING